VKESVALLRGASVGTITVVGFPLGYSTSASKAIEASEAIEQGACEIDMVLNVSYLKSGRTADAQADVARRTIVGQAGTRRATGRRLALVSHDSSLPRSL